MRIIGGVACDGEGQAARRTDPAEQDVGQRGAAFHARIKCLEDRRCLFAPALHKHGGTRDDRNDDGRSRRGDGFAQRDLHRGQVER